MSADVSFEDLVGGLDRDGLVRLVLEQATALKALMVERDDLIRRVSGLEARFEARDAGGSSNTSGTPPSADLPKTRAERRRDAREKAKKRAAEPGRRKPGKQPGAPGAGLPRVHDPDDVVVHEPDACTGCGADLGDAEPVGEQVRQVFDVPVPNVIVTEHRAVKKRCACGHVTVGVFPGEATAPTCYGPHIRAYAVYLMAHQHVPFERCAEALHAMFGVNVSPGSLDRWYDEASAALDPFIARVTEALLGSPVVHFDETPSQVGLDQWWFHVACNDLYTLIHADETRGKDAVTRAGILDHFTGVAVHDRLL